MHGQKTMDFWGGLHHKQQFEVGLSTLLLSIPSQAYRNEQHLSDS